MRKRELIAALTGAVVVVVIAGSVAWAAIPGPGGAIQGCYDSGGNVKVVDAVPQRATRPCNGTSRVQRVPRALPERTVPTLQVRSRVASTVHRSSTTIQPGRHRR